MGYTYPTKIYTPSSPSVEAVATELAQRQSGSLTTNGGIVAAGGSAQAPQLGVDAAGLGLSYLQAIADVTLAACGFQGQSQEAASVASSTSETDWINVPGFPGWTFTAPIAKTYLVHADCTAKLAGFSNVVLELRIAVNGVGYGERGFLFVVDGSCLPMSWRAAAPMVKGANDVRLQWRMGLGVTASTTADNFRTLTVTG